ncbi:MAG: DUF2723 domain-containing protein [Chitinivibrionales bacterium]|nr:DUF2723 domain-containing protein [Chitinivibrionales bacterium]
MEQTHKKYNQIGALFVLVFTFIMYSLTVGPTVSFWDCGEYIGASHSLGVPHPPGNPLYVLLGRFFSMMFFYFRQVAFRVNLISVISGAFTAMFIYLIIIKSLTAWLGIPDSLPKRIITYSGGIVGALFAAFGYTFWFSAVEASVYIPSMLVIVMATYIVMVWSQRTDSKRDRLLVLFSYLAFLGIGIHMMAMVAMAPAFLFVVLTDEEKLKDWRLWFMGLLMASVIYQVSAFLYIAPLMVIFAAIYTFVKFKDSRYIGLGVFGSLLVLMAFVKLKALSDGDIDGKSFITGLIPYAMFTAAALYELAATTLAEGIKTSRRWRFIFWITAFAVVGYSVHFYIPIRSALQPVIDENHPVIEFNKEKFTFEWEAFKQFLERKQYGSENFILRMFHRRGDLRTQFGVDGHMGFGGFHITQFFHFGPTIGQDREQSFFKTNDGLIAFLKLLIYLIPTMFVIFGFFYFYARRKNIGVLLISLMLVGTAGLVFYMNFADGTRLENRDYTYWKNSISRAMNQGLSRTQAEARIPKPAPVHREVRIRDYFFTSGFMFFGMWIGIAGACLLHLLFYHRDMFMRTTMAPICAVLLVVSPVLPIVQNFSENNRKGDWVPYDYAYNLLMSCDKDGILFTNGDNDTFPLWFLQEAEGIRRDVRIVNLSLLNTKWYIKQLRNIEPKVHITFSDAQIDALTHELNPFEKSFDYPMSNAGITVKVPGRDQKNALRVQDKMVLHIIDANKWRKPIYFAVTVSNDNKMGSDPYLQMKGLVYRIYPENISAAQRMDLDKTNFMLEKVYAFRGLGDGTALMNETSFKLLSNYAASFIQVAISQRNIIANLKNEVDRLADRVADTSAVADTIQPSQSELKQRLAAKRQEYQDKLNMVVDRMDQCVALMPWDWRPRLLRQEYLLAHERYTEAEARAREAMIIQPDNPEYVKALAQVLVQTGKQDEANELMQKMTSTQTNPWDVYAMMARNYQERGLYDSAIAVMKQFQKMQPGDQRAIQFIQHFENLKRREQQKQQDTAVKTSPQADTQSRG